MDVYKFLNVCVCVCMCADFPVRLRFADLPAAGGAGPGQGRRDRYQAPPARQVLERGLTTADLKARVALKEKTSVRPPDLDKLGEKQPAKQARAGTTPPHPPWLQLFTP